MTAPTQKFDPAKVAHLLRGYRARHDAQRLLADELENLADEARREQYRQESDYRACVEAWRGHGVKIPEALADLDEDWR